jgi:hypothetical protein
VWLLEEAAIDANIMMVLTLEPNSNFMRHFFSLLLCNEAQMIALLSAWQAEFKKRFFYER